MGVKRYLVQSQLDIWREHIRYNEDNEFIYLICIYNGTKCKIHVQDKKKQYFFNTSIVEL
tara:strand:+ start:198 stop:377 length:180 start_codon:yes stop_codon:yes gene_type:complete